MTYGPTPWVQRHWDLRAATNFVAGGAGAGLIVVSVASGARGTPAAIAMLAGLALVGVGLFAVWLEIGRPLRALNVFRNPRTSWMSREAIAAGVPLAPETTDTTTRPAPAPPATKFAAARRSQWRCTQGVGP